MFSEYEHMENHYNIVKHYQNPKSKLFVEPSTIWISQEKLHGTAYSLITDGFTVTPCKRSSSLGTDRNFYGHGPVYTKYKLDVITLFTELKSKYPSLQQIQLYGELFGGLYNGETDNGSKKVQKGINYCPSNDFMAFDLKLTLPNKVFYLNFDDVVDLFESLNLKVKTVPIIARGTLSEILQLNPKFESEVYKNYGLEKVENNFAEGFVVKTCEESVTGGRRIFKFKNPQFSEVMNSGPIVSGPKTMTFQQQCLEILKTYVTENRFDNIRTKFGEDEEDIEKKLIYMMYKDVVTDFKADHDDNPDDLLCNEDNVIANIKQLTGFITGFVRRKLLNKS